MTDVEVNSEGTAWRGRSRRASYLGKLSNHGCTSANRSNHSNPVMLRDVVNTFIVRAVHTLSDIHRSKFCACRKCLKLLYWSEHTKLMT
jgi:hypothetical protein